MTRQQNQTSLSALLTPWILALASATLLLSGCVAGEVGGRAIDLVGHGSDGVLPVRQSTSCGCGGGGGSTYPGYPSNPYPNNPNNPSNPSNPYPPQTPPPSTPQTPPSTPSTPGGPGNPGPTGNYGAVCQQASDCTSGPCVRGPDGVAFCTAQCTPSSNICPAEAGCHATSVANMYVCGKPSTPNPGGNTTPPPTQPQNDQAAPVVYITAPLTGSTVPSQVMVKANVSDNVGLKIVELYVDGTLASSTSAGPFEFPVTLQPGKHLITLRAIDTSGNSTDAQATVTVAATGDPGSPTGPGTPTTPGPSGPLGGLQYGQSCSQPGDCASGMCANDVSIGLQYCSQTCLPGTGACPAGSGCYAANAGVYVCAVDSAPGAPQNNNNGGLGTQTQGAATCSVGASPSATAPAGLVLLGLALLGMRRRRRRRRR